MFEVEALLGSIHGTHVPNPQVFLTIVSVRVRLQKVADLTRSGERTKIGTSIQELTGDWRSYSLRNPVPPTNPPFYSNVPTQRLGRALHDRPDIEGFQTYSARVPTLKNRVVFPDKIQPPSLVQCLDPMSGSVVDQIP
ncbi:MAG TPA: hypothetical protein VG406_00335 [Isosphaeraceae bacterium]|jgi:hypothetical protein|nr:hypothetical protein [Isosphaeraceae bacterium]